jgi:hypothetical protein
MHIAKSLKYETRKGLAWVSLGVSVFRQPGNPRVSLLVHVSPEIPMGEVLKEQYVDRLRDFGISEIGILKGVFPCTRIPELPTCEVPKWLNTDGIWCVGVSAPGIPDGKFLMLTSPENPVCEFPKWTERHIYTTIRMLRFQSFGSRET